MKNKVWVCCSLIVGLMACEASHELGSDCPNDVCPRAAGRAEPACLVRDSSRLLQIDYGENPQSEPVSDPGLFLESRLANSGVHRMFWKLEGNLVLPNGETLRACDDLPFLEEPDADDLGVEALRRDGVTEENPNPRVCRVKQAKRTPDGEFDGDGWYVGERTPASDDAPSGFLPLRFTPSVGRLPDRVTIWVATSGAELITRDGTLKETDPDVCSLPDDSAMHEDDVGRSCSLTSSVEGGYTESETVVEAGSTQCATGVCIVYKLAGDATKPCGKKSSSTSCQNQRLGASEDEIAKRVYCSCRCDAPDGDPGELCTCKSGFSCVPTLFSAAAGVRGSYCLKDGTFSAFGL